MRQLEAPQIGDEIIVVQEVDVDDARGKMLVTPCDRGFHVAKERLERSRIEIGRKTRSRVEKFRTGDVTDRDGLIKRGDCIDTHARAQALERLQDIALPLAEVRADAD